MALTRSEEAKIIRTRVRQRLAGDSCETMELGACGRMMTRKRSNGLQSATKEEALGGELLFGERAPLGTLRTVRPLDILAVQPST